VHQAILALGDETVAIPFQLVNPLRPGRDLVSRDRLARSDKACWLAPVASADGTKRRHAEVMADEILDEKAEGSWPRQENDAGGRYPRGARGCDDEKVMRAGVFAHVTAPPLARAAVSSWLGQGPRAARGELQTTQNQSPPRGEDDPVPTLKTEEPRANAAVHWAGHRGAVDTPAPLMAVRP
jgi:hypothetical protein